MTKEKLEPSLNLVVVYVDDIDAVGDFFTALGLDFVRHRHGKGPNHLACERNGLVFELYPSSESNPCSHLRLGLAVDDMSATLVGAKAKGATVLSEPASSPWGTRAVVRSPIGLTIELIENTG